MSKIGIDVDEVLAEFVSNFIAYYNNKTGQNLKFDDINSYDFFEYNKDAHEIFEELVQLQLGGFYKTFNKFEGADTYTKQLKDDGHELLIITSRIGAKGTLEWLVDNDITFDDVFLIKKKKHIYKLLALDYVIEDCPTHIESSVNLGIKTLVFDKPWNKDIKDSELITRVYSWKDIYNNIK